MAGSHRAQHAARGRSSRVPPWAIAVAVVLALVPAVWFTAHRVFDSSSSSSSTSSPGRTTTDLPIPPVSPSTPVATSPTTPTRTPGTSPSPTPRAPLPSVAPDAPRRLVSGNLLDTGFDNAVTALDAASTSEVARWASRGSPGSPGTDTVYVIGKVIAGGDSAFANLPQVKPGARVTIRTDSGTLTYTVRSATLEPEAGLAGNPVLTRHRPGLLVLLGIRYGAAGNRLADALVVSAELTDARKS